MRTILVSLTMLAQMIVGAAPLLAHGDEPHPKCKKGYVVNDDHKCVKASG